MLQITKIIATNAALMLFRLNTIICFHWFCAFNWWNYFMIIINFKVRSICFQKLMYSYRFLSSCKHFTKPIISLTFIPFSCLLVRLHFSKKKGVFENKFYIWRHRRWSMNGYFYCVIQHEKHKSTQMLCIECEIVVIEYMTIKYIHWTRCNIDESNLYRVMRIIFGSVWFLIRVDACRSENKFQKDCVFFFQTGIAIHIYEKC